jgi:hypothetical protein
MVKQVTTKISVVKKLGKKKGSVYRSPRIYLPTKLTDDSMFPFIEGEQVRVEVIGEKLVITRFGSRKRRLRRRA